MHRQFTLGSHQELVAVLFHEQRNLVEGGDSNLLLLRQDLEANVLNNALGDFDILYYEFHD